MGKIKTLRIKRYNNSAPSIDTFSHGDTVILEPGDQIYGDGRSIVVANHGYARLHITSKYSEVYLIIPKNLVNPEEKYVTHDGWGVCRYLRSLPAFKDHIDDCYVLRISERYEHSSPRNTWFQSSRLIPPTDIFSRNIRSIKSTSTLHLVRRNKMLYIKPE